MSGMDRPNSHDIRTYCNIPRGISDFYHLEISRFWVFFSETRVQKLSTEDAYVNMRGIRPSVWEILLQVHAYCCDTANSGAQRHCWALTFNHHATNGVAESKHNIPSEPS